MKKEKIYGSLVGLWIALIFFLASQAYGQTISFRQIEKTSPVGAGSLVTTNTAGVMVYTASIPYSRITGTPVLTGSFVPYTGATASVNLGANNFSVGAQSTLNTLYVPSTATVNGAFLSNGGARLTNGTTNCIFGNYSASIPAFWMRSSGQYTTTTNYNLGHSTTSFLINDSVKINFAINDATLFSMTSLGVPFNTHVKIGASSTPGTASPTLDVIGTMSVSGTASISGGALVTSGTSSTYIGGRSAAFPAIWLGFNSTNTTTSNYAIGGDGSGNTYLQSGAGSIFMHYNGTQRYGFRPTYMTLAPQATSGGGDITFQLTAPAHLAQPASVNTPVFKLTGATKQFNKGALTTQYFNHFSQNTLAFVGASTGTDIYNFYSDNVAQGTNATITRKWAGGFGGNVDIAGDNSQFFTLRVTQANGAVYAGAPGASVGALWVGSTALSIGTGNYAVKGDNTTNHFNAVTTLNLNISNVNKAALTSASLNIGVPVNITGSLSASSNSQFGTDLTTLTHKFYTAASITGGAMIGATGAGHGTMWHVSNSGAGNYALDFTTSYTQLNGSTHVYQNINNTLTEHATATNKTIMLPVSINKTETNAHASAILQAQSTTKGFLPPVMTAAQGSAISSPAEGLMIYVTDTDATFTSKGWWGYNGEAWEKLNN